MRLRVLTILAVVPLLAIPAMGAGALHNEVIGIVIPEPASLALLGAAMLGFTKLLRKKLGS
jgi:hypothetical protein